MSFTTIVKNELSKLELSKVEAISELSAIIFNSCVVDKTIKISTENSSVARHVFNLIKEVYNVNCKITVRHGYNYNKKMLYILEITNKLDIIIKDLCLDREIPLEYIISDDNLIRIYLRGIFISCGSINDPKKSRYHMEFSFSSYEYSLFINNLLNNYKLNSKVLKRDNRYMIYIKEAFKIGDFLRMINAVQALFYYEDIRIYRDHKNMTNRLNNCEQANVDKIIETALEQVKDINYIINNGGLDLLDSKTRVAAVYRMKYKEASLTELSEIISIETTSPITKSGLHHRFTKIKNLAKKIKEKTNNND